MTRAAFCKKIDHTLLKPEATPQDIDRICVEAREMGFASVCVNGLYAKRVAENLRGTNVLTCCVVGFPLGAMASSVKAAEAAQAVKDGAQEIDMVLPVGLLKAGEDEAVEDDIRGVVQASMPAQVKVILETCLLTKEEIVRACLLSKKAGAAFVTTSTGFSSGGAVAEDVRLMRKTVGDTMGVKASGGIRTREDVAAMLEAGASRIGASAGYTMAKEF